MRKWVGAALLGRAGQTFETEMKHVRRSEFHQWLVAGLVAGGLVFAPEALGQSSDVPGMLRVTVVVELSCPSCAQGLERRLGRLDYVDLVEVRSESGQIVLTPERGAVLDLHAVRQVIRNVGFQPVELRVHALGEVKRQGDGFVLALPDNVLLALDAKDATDVLLSMVGAPPVEVAGVAVRPPGSDHDVLAVNAVGDSR